jgi:hypothetical protein
MNIKSQIVNLNELNETCFMESKVIELNSMQCKTGNFKNLFLHRAIVVLLKLGNLCNEIHGVNE